MKRISKNIIKCIMTFVLTVAMVLGEVPLPFIPASIVVHAATNAAKIGDKEYETLDAAISAVSSGETITLLTDVTISSVLFPPYNKTVTLDLNGYGILQTGNGRVISVGMERSFILKDSNDTTTHYITLSDGRGTAVSDTQPSGTEGTDYIKVIGGYITGGMGSSADGSGSTSGGGVLVGGNNSTFTMEAGTICGCKSKDTGGGGVYSYNGAAFNMKGGTITNCTAQGGGGGVYINNGTFNMEAGTICSCESITTGGGGVYSSNGAAFNMKGGTITDCTANMAGGVCANATFNMSGGTIQKCTAVDGAGGGVLISSGKTFTMTGGSITNCIAANRNKGGGVYVAGSFNVKESPNISDNKAGSIANNVSFDGTDRIISVTGVLKNGARIYVNGGEGANIASGSGYTLVSNDAEKFHSDVDSNLLGALDSGKVVFKKTLTEGMIESIADQTYTGSAIEPTVTVKDGNKTLVADMDYTVMYSNNTNSAASNDANAPTVTVTGKGGYCGTVTRKFSITPKSVTITGLTVSNKIFDGTATAEVSGTATIEGKVENDDVRVAAGTAAFSDVNAGIGKTVTFSGWSLAGAAKDNYTLAAQPESVKADISKRSITIKASDQSVELNGEISTATDKVDVIPGDGLVNGNVISAITLTTDNAMNVVGSYPGAITASAVKIVSDQTDVTSNYAVTYAEGNLEVKKVKAKITTVAEKESGLIYTGSAQALLASAAVADSGTVQYKLGDGEWIDDTIPSATASGTYTVCIRAKADDSHIEGDISELTVIIGKAPLTVTANDTTITYGDYPADNGVTYSGFVNGETTAVLNGNLGYDFSYSQYGNAGDTYTITPKGLTSYNYEITYADGKLNVEPKEIGLDWSGTDFAYTGEAQKPTAAATELVNGDSCTVSISGEQTDAGTYTATAESLSNSNYSLPADKTIAFRINKATTTPNTPEQTMYVDYSVKKVGDIKLSGDWAIRDEDKDKDLVVGTPLKVTALYIGDDKGNYETESVAIEVTRAECKHTGMVATEAKAPTCVDAGNTAYWYCPECGRYYSDSKGETEMAKDSWILEALGHEYGEPIYTWSDDGKNCTAKTICTRKECTDDTEGHTVTEKVQSTGKETKAVTCEEKGITTYTATFENELFKTQTKEVADIDAKGHRYGIITYEWSEDGKSCTATSVCSNDSTHKITETAIYESDKADSQIKATVKEAATTEKMGTTTYTATFKNTEMFKVQTKDVVDIPKVEVTANPSDIPSDEPSDNPSDNPSKQEDTTKPADTTNTDVKDDGKTPSNNNTTDTPATPVPKEEGAILPVSDTKAEYVVNSKAGEEPAVEYKPATDVKDKTVTVPEAVTADGVTYKVTEIAKEAFKGNKTIESIELSENIETIGKNAFDGCTSLKKVTIPNGVTEIGDCAFNGCTSLKKVTIPNSVTEIGNKAFNGCKKLTIVNVGKNVVKVGDRAFAGCSSVKKVTLPAKTNKIGKQAFKGTKKLKTLNIKSKKLTAKSISANAFKGIGNNVTIKVPKGMKKAYKALFRKKGLPKKVKIK